jgi:hypothetical protein
VATASDVESAIDRLAQSARELDDQTRAKIPNRSASVHLLDLDIAYTGQFVDGELTDLSPVLPETAATAAFRVTCSSDDFIELVDGRLGFGSAWAGGRIRIDAKFRDLLELRKFL